MRLNKSGCWTIRLPQKIMLAGIKVLVAKVPTICAVLGCQGGGSGQITAGGWGEGKGGIFKRVLLALQEQKNLS